MMCLKLRLLGARGYLPLARSAVPGSISRGSSHRVLVPRYGEQCLSATPLTSEATQASVTCWGCARIWCMDRMATSRCYIAGTVGILCPPFTDGRYQRNGMASVSVKLLDVLWTLSGTRSTYRCSCHLPEENVLLEPQVQLRKRLDTFAAASCTERTHDME